MYKRVKNLDGSVSVDAILRINDQAWIPFNEANTDYQAYLKWLSEGNEPLPADNTNQPGTGVQGGV